MINDLLDVLSYENIYLAANWGVILFWLLLIMFPNHSVTNFFVQSIIAPLILASACLLYTSQSPRDKRGSRMPDDA